MFVGFNQGFNCFVGKKNWKIRYVCVFRTIIKKEILLYFWYYNLIYNLSSIFFVLVILLFMKKVKLVFE